MAVSDAEISRYSIFARVKLKDKVLSNLQFFIPIGFDILIKIVCMEIW